MYINLSTPIPNKITSHIHYSTSVQVILLLIRITAAVSTGARSIVSVRVPVSGVPTSGVPVVPTFEVPATAVTMAMVVAVAMVAVSGIIAQLVICEIGIGARIGLAVAR